MLARHPERTRLDELLESIRDGRSSTLLLSGGAGVGKTTLLNYLVQNSAGVQILGVTGIQSEIELPYAALHQLCRPLMSTIDSLPDPLQDALETTFGMRGGSLPDKFLLGLATLSLLSDASRAGPILCVVDDAQWLDSVSAEVLGFVARRLDAEGVGMAFAARTPHHIPGLEGVPLLALTGLERRDAHELLLSLAHGATDPGALHRILDEADGNPLVLMESVRALTREELATGILLADAPSQLTRIEEQFRQRVILLPPDTQQLLLIAAAEPLGDARAIQFAAAKSGIDSAAVRPAIEAGLCEPGVGIRFRHPLVRSTVYRTASPASVRAAHSALAAADPAIVQPDLLAWHRARANEGKDEDTAAGLAHAAARATARGALALAAVLLRQALGLTASDDLRAEWSLQLAQIELSAGQFADAAKDLGVVSAASLRPVMRAEARLTEARLAFVRERGGAAIPLFLEAADQLAKVDPGAAQAAYLEALSAALFAGNLAQSADLTQVALRWRASGAPPGHRPVDLLRDAFVSVISDGDDRAWNQMHAALVALQSDGDQQYRAVPWLRVAFSATAAAWDLDAWEYVSRQLVELSRARGDYSELPMALSSLAFVHLFAGELSTASDTVSEMATITSATGAEVSPYGAIGVAALQGREADLAALIETTVPAAEARTDATGVAIGYWASAILKNGLGRYDEALASASRAVPLHHSLHATSAWALVELIEAASRLNGSADAGTAMDQLETAAKFSGTDWALGVLARSRALISTDTEAEALYVEALRRLDSSRARLDAARAYLVYGEWLRRQKRLADARDRLTRAQQLFDDIGATAFARRASAELQAAGSQVRKPGRVGRPLLTSQEAQIARLVSEGLSNNDVAARMFLSPRTVEYHLGKIFNKLHINSRHQIATVSPDVLSSIGEPSK